MPDAPDLAEYRAVVAAVEPAARVVPARALRRAIRQSRDRGTFRPRAIHDRCWWVRRDDLFEWLTPGELGLSKNEPAELLLIPAPEPGSPTPTYETIWRTLFHAAIDRKVDTAIRDGRLTAEIVRRVRQQVGPARWQIVRTVLVEERLVDEAERDETVVREFVAFGLELAKFKPGDWEDFFPGLSPDGEPLRSARLLLNVEGAYERSRPGPPPADQVRAATVVPVSEPGPPVAAPKISEWVVQGNDLKAAVLLARAGDPHAEGHLDHLIERFARVFDVDADGVRKWGDATRPLLAPAAAGGWPVERRLLYELQRACLALERTNYTIDLIEWVRTLGRRPLKRPLPKTRWVDAHNRLRAALLYADRLTGATGVLRRLLADAVRQSEVMARDDLRQELIGVLDDVALVPESAPERRSREKLVEELLDGACARGFFRIGDLRDAIARNRVKLPDLRGPGELVRGDALIRANELLPLRLDGVYRRGEIYMRLLQRGCSVFFGTPVGRWFSKYMALPFGGAFILLEAIGHLHRASEGLVNWLSGWTATVNGVSLLGGAAAGMLADNPKLEASGVSWEAVLAVGVFLLLLLYWQAFRTRVAWMARFLFVNVPRAVRRSPFFYRLVHNRATRFFRRYLLLPLTAGGAATLAAAVAGADATSVALVGTGTALLAGTFFRTPFGRELEDRLDGAMERIWRVVSVNFVVGLLTLVLHFFRAVFEAIDRGMHAVDEALRFHEGQGRGAFTFKLIFGTGWFMFTYLFRFAWTLLVEPQINPIKHFPVVTVSHKILLPLIPPLAKQFGVTKETMATMVFGIPGIFGFLAWELRENWKLYRANAPKGIRPIQIGSHGETVRGFLRPGFHSGTVPKSFAKLRRAVRAGDHGKIARQRHAIDHVREAIERFVERCFLSYLRASTRWGNEAAVLGHPVVAPNRIVLTVVVGFGREPVQIALEERNGWIIGSVADVGGLGEVRPEQQAAFVDALLGLYKRAGVHVVREQVASVFGPQAYQFDAIPEGLVIPLPDGKEHEFDYEDGPEIELPDRRLPTHEVVLSDCTLPWADWAARWDADAAGKAPLSPLIPGWTVLPNVSNGGPSGSPR
jgi:hypothetical protein